MSSSTFFFVLAIGVRFAGSIAALYGLIYAYRWIRQRSKGLALIFLAGLLLHGATDVLLYAISLYGWPLFKSLQLGEGFWALAPDGRMYYDLALGTFREGMGALGPSTPSLFYVRTLALWLWVFGASPFSALILNVLCYVASAVLLVSISVDTRPRAGIEDLGGVVALSALAFSPALLIFGAQPLKDTLCTLLVVAVIAGAHAFWGPQPPIGRRARRIVGVALMAAGTYGVAGIRTYASLFAVLCAGAAAVYRLATARHGFRIRAAGEGIVLMTILWLAFAAGAGVFKDSYESYMSSEVTKPSTAADLYDSARAAFDRTGGATTVQFESDSAAAGRWRRLAQGFLVLVAPISMLKSLSIVKMSGGRGLLAITDIDTIIVDLSIFATLFLFVRSSRRGLEPAAILAFVLAVVTAGSLAYVVTNYGTLFRLRLLATVPFWTLAALTRGTSGARSEQGRERVSAGLVPPWSDTRLQ